MELKFYSIELIRNGKSIIHTYRKYAVKSISCARKRKGGIFFMWEGIIPISINATLYAKSDLILELV
jgi:hypothetical protein